MSKADYLSKYISGPAKKKKKRKSAASNIVVDLPIEYQQEEPEVVEENEMAPVHVEMKTREFKGFKRIDDGTVVDQPTASPESTAQSQQTVYRDLSGRIIDIDEKRQQVREEKERAAHKFTEIRLSEQEQELQSKQTKGVEKGPRTNLSTAIDDPMALFSPETPQINLEIDNYTYSKGVNPVNRFGIKAGYFWDGIDRGNGFEEMVLRKW